MYISVFDIFHFDRETRAGISDTSAAKGEGKVEHGLEEARRFKHPPTRNIGTALGTSPTHLEMRPLTFHGSAFDPLFMVYPASWDDRTGFSCIWLFEPLPIARFAITKQESLFSSR